MPEKLPTKDSSATTESQKLRWEGQERVLSEKELDEERLAQEAKEEEKTNPKKIAELKREVGEKLERKETTEEYQLRAEKEFEKILSIPDSRDRDEKIKEFLAEKRAGGAQIDVGYTWQENILKKFYHSFTGERVFRPLSGYFYHNSYKGLEELNSDIARDKEIVPELNGVTDVQEIDLENGKKGYLVKIDKRRWPSLTVIGCALPRRGVAFIPNGLSQDAERAITDHEVYHLNNHASEQLKPGIGKFFRELDTIWNTNIKKNFIGSVSLQVQGFINTPSTIINVIRNFIK